MSNNNFKELEEQELKDIEFDSVGVQNKINSSVNIFRFVTDMIELYIPKVVDTVLNMVSENKDDIKK